MKTLYLLRHAKAGWGEPEREDHERQLTPRGRSACKTLATLLAELPSPELAWCSSATRARETFAHTRDHWQHPPTLELTPDLYLAGPSAILQVLQRTDPAIERVLVVGHNPGLQQLAVGLTDGDTNDARERAHAGFPTAALAVIELPEASWALRLASGTLRRFVTPRELS